MISRESIKKELERKRENFQTYARAFSDGLDGYKNALSALELADYADIEQLLGSHEEAGAVPANELGTNRSFVFPFEQSWDNHEQARAWAFETLQNRTTFAADGSQIYAGKETTLPVGAVQIGWFENPHNETKPYEKNVRFEILTPEDLFKDQDDPMNPDVRVEERRYLGEAERLIEFLEKSRGWQARGERMPLVFFDNPLLVPFSQKGLQKSFLDATVNLVKVSRETGVPLVGYVARSFSRDILSMLDYFTEYQSRDQTTLFDGALISAKLDKWGGRTCFCYSKRRGLSAFDDAATGRSMVGFAYLYAASDSPPARIDVPAWVYEDGSLDEVIDVVRAECVIGLGYPYALETADQTAVISSVDRDVFLRALQELAAREKLGFSVSRKAASKARRR